MLQTLFHQLPTTVRRATATCFLVALIACQLPAAHTTEPSDAAALNAIIGESALTKNATQIIITSRRLPPEQRYAYLSQWVLPNHGHDYRMEGTIERLPQHAADIADPSVLEIADFPESNWIICPARDLVQLARELGRLHILRDQVLRQPAVSNDSKTSQETLLTLIDIAAHQRERVTEQIAERFSAVRNEQDDDAVGQWWSDLIVLWSAMENPKTADLVIADYFGVFELNTYKPDLRLDVIADYLYLLFRVQSNKPWEHNTQHVLGTAMFDVFSRMDAYTHSRCSPLPRYHYNERGAIKLSGHEDDYIVLRSPMAGNFEVVSEIATHSGAFSELVLAGIGVKPTSDLGNVAISGFAKGNRELATVPSIEPIGNSSRSRVQSDAETATHYWNSRETFVDSTTDLSAPWVGVRSWRRTRSAIPEFSIAGSPTIPNHIELISGKSLRGWASYFDSESGNGLGQWTAAYDINDHWTLTSKVTAESRGCYDENLLYYVRPLTWNAKVIYEFEYQTQNCAVHPCLGRSVFIIRPDGVWLHQLTDGKNATSGIRPDNAIRVAGSTECISLKPGWNRAELRLEQDRLELWLNENLIATHVIKPSQSRTFGLFHYRDQTRVNVRNVRLTGEWPRTMPALEQQPLAAHKQAALDAAAKKLEDVWIHDFRHGIPKHVFTLDGNANRATQLADGIRLNRTGAASALSLNFAGQIKGDFDIILEFKDLEIGDEQPTWHCGAGMAVSIENKSHDRMDIVRRRDRLSRHHHIALSHNHVNRFGGVDWIRDTTHIDESVAGRMRMIRQGDVIYGLYADGDSQCFRLLDKETIEPGTISVDGLRLYTIAGKGMNCEVTLVRLDVRAEAIDFPAKPDSPVFKIIDATSPNPNPSRPISGTF